APAGASPATNVPKTPAESRSGPILAQKDCESRSLHTSAPPAAQAAARARTCVCVYGYPRELRESPPTVSAGSQPSPRPLARPRQPCHASGPSQSPPALDEIGLNSPPALGPHFPAVPAAHPPAPHGIQHPDRCESTPHPPLL